VRSFHVPEGIEDRRGRFREIFCAVLEARGASVPDYRPCDEALTVAGNESRGTGVPVELGLSQRRLTAVIVPGLGWDCISNWLHPQGTLSAYIRQFNFELVDIHVDALSSSRANANQVRDRIMAMEWAGGGPDLVLIGYSKGTPDILEAVVASPEIRSRIAAVVSIAGAVRGSPLADDVKQTQLNFLRRWPGAECSLGDGGAIASLRPETRTAWLADHPLPREVRFYSLITYPDHDRVSSALKPAYRELLRAAGDNDGMMPVSSQVIPGSTLVACLNADHWAVAVPIARTHPKLAKTLVDRNDYPREALLEAVLRFVEEDLSGPAR
jgi:hypothetical protein